jgi:hypothetical protein
MCLHGTVYMYRSRILWMYILYILCIHAKRFGFPCKLSTWGIFFMSSRYNHVCMMRVHLLADFIWRPAYLITAVRQFEWPLFFHPCFKNIIKLPYFTKFHLCSLLSLQSVNTIYWFLFWIVAFISKNTNRFAALCRLITQSISPTHGFSSLQVQCHLNRPSLPI